MEIDVAIGRRRSRGLAARLGQLLVDTHVLYFRTKFFHRTIHAPGFQTLRLMLKEQYTELALAVDALASRAQVVGRRSSGIIEELVEFTDAMDCRSVPSAAEMIEVLLAGHEATIATARSLLAAALEAHDEATTDLVLDRLRVHEKAAWTLRSMREE